MSYQGKLFSIIAVSATSSLAAYAGQDAGKGAQDKTQAERPMVQSATAKAFKGEELSKSATVTLAEARAIALKAHPGRIADEELETEAGGSGLRYSFDIKDAKGTQEVGVDAKTGKILENAPADKD